MEDEVMGDGVVVPSELRKESVRLWRAWRTVNELCRDRGYELSDEEVTISHDEFERKFCASGIPDRKRLTFQAGPSATMLKKYTPLPTKADPNPTAQIGTVLVQFWHQSSLGIRQLRDFVHEVEKNHFHTGILVTQTSVTPAALKILPSVLPLVIEIFQEEDLLVNITQHELVPAHVLLSAEEKRHLLERYRLKENQLPRIQASDPVARYLGLRRGQVVKIIRRSETAGRYASYRWVI